MTIRRVAGLILGSAAACSAVGAVVGLFMGLAMPQYYRSVFQNGNDLLFDPIRVGMGQGLTQGITGGVLVGIVLVAVFSWRDIRLRRLSQAMGETDQHLSESISVAKRSLFWSLSLLLGLLLLASGFIAGAVFKEVSLYHRRYIEERDALQPLLQKEPQFAHVEVHRRSNGGVYLMGSVPNELALQQLKQVTTQAIGELRAEKAIRGLSINK